MLFLVFVTGTAFAAPDEDTLGRARGYPACAIYPQPTKPECLVGALSHFDKLLPARVVTEGRRGARAEARGEGAADHLALR